MALEIKKPTSNTDTTGWTSAGQCYDFPSTAGDETTMGYDLLDGDFIPAIVFDTWASKVETYTATVLKCKWKTSIQTGDDEFGIEYTKDGSTWNDLLAIGVNRSVAYSTAQISLDANQDLSLVGVRVNFDKVKGGDGVDIQISDIWTEGTYTGAVQVSPTVITGQGTVHSPTVKYGVKFTATTISGRGTIHDPTVKTAVKFTATTITAYGTVHSPTVQIGNSFIATVITGIGSTHSPTVKYGVKYSATLITGQGTVHSPIIKYGVKFTASVITGLGTTHSPIFKIGIKVSPSIISGQGSTHAPTIKYGVAIDVTVVTSQGTIHAPTINITTADVDVYPSVITGQGIVIDPSIQTGVIVNVSVQTGQGTVHPVVAGEVLVGVEVFVADSIPRFHLELDSITGQGIHKNSLTRKYLCLDSLVKGD